MSNKIVGFLSTFADTCFPPAKHVELRLFQQNVATAFGGNLASAAAQYGKPNSTPAPGNLVFWETATGETHCGVYLPDRDVLRIDADTPYRLAMPKDIVAVLDTVMFLSPLPISNLSREPLLPPVTVSETSSPSTPTLKAFALSWEVFIKPLSSIPINTISSQGLKDLKAALTPSIYAQYMSYFRSGLERFLNNCWNSVKNDALFVGSNTEYSFTINTTYNGTEEETNPYRRSKDYLVLFLDYYPVTTSLTGGTAPLATPCLQKAIQSETGVRVYFYPPKINAFETENQARGLVAQNFFTKTAIHEALHALGMAHTWDKGLCNPTVVLGIGLDMRPIVAAACRS